MHTIALTAQKGGAGKSTLTVHLAALADAEAGPAIILDIDPQGSSRFWFNLRKAERPLLVQCSHRDIPSTLVAAKREGIQWAFIDCPPRADGAAIASALRGADLALCPMRPSAFDLAAISETLEAARRLGRPHIVVINAAPVPRGDKEVSLVTEARQALETMGTRCMAATISQRAALSHALAGGLSVHEFDPEGKATAEVRCLWKEVKALTNGRA